MNNTFEMFIKGDLPAHTIISWWVKLEELWAGHKIDVLFSAIVEDCCWDNEGQRQCGWVYMCVNSIIKSNKNSFYIFLAVLSHTLISKNVSNDEDS